MSKVCYPHELSYALYGRDDQTVQLKCLKCGKIISVDSRDYDEEMQREAADEFNYDIHGFDLDDEDDI
jgi:Fe2+ or Zn2+ uptake regulation protein